MYCGLRSSPNVPKQAFSLPFLLLLLNVAGLRGRRLEVERWGDGVINTQSMQICCPNKNARAAFSNFFHPETRFKKSVLTGNAFTGSIWTIGQNKCVYTKKLFHVDGLLITCYSAFLSWTVHEPCQFVMWCFQTGCFLLLVCNSGQ